MAYYNSSSSFLQYGAGPGQSDSCSRPHYQLPGEYGAYTSSTSQMQATAHDRYGYMNSTSVQAAPQADLRGYNSSSSTSHQSPAHAFRGSSMLSNSSHQSPPNHDYSSTSSTLTHYTPRDHHSQNSTLQTYLPPAIMYSGSQFNQYSASPWEVSTSRHETRSSNIRSRYTDKSNFSLQDAREAYQSLRRKVDEAKYASDLDEAYSDARVLKARLKHVRGPSSMSVLNWKATVESIEEKVGSTMQQIVSWKKRTGSY